LFTFLIYQKLSAITAINTSVIAIAAIIAIVRSIIIGLSLKLYHTSSLYYDFIEWVYYWCYYLLEVVAFIINHLSMMDYYEYLVKMKQY